MAGQFAYSGYSYRKTHTTVLGTNEEFAPHIEEEAGEFVCSLCRCVPYVERAAKTGAVVTGICSDHYYEIINRQEKYLPKEASQRLSNRLIYAMKVFSISYGSFKKDYPKASKYLEKHENKREVNDGTPVLISKEFYYFGDKAIDIATDANLLLLVVIPKYRYQGISQPKATELRKYLPSQKKFEEYRNGRYRTPISLETRI